MNPLLRRDPQKLGHIGCNLYAELTPEAGADYGQESTADDAKNRRDSQAPGDKRKNIPTAVSVRSSKEEEKPKKIKYPRNTDLDPQLVWRGKDEQDWSDLVVHAPPLYIQEKVQPKVLIDDLLRADEGSSSACKRLRCTPDLFADFNGIPKVRTRPSSISTTRTGRTA